MHLSSQRDNYFVLILYSSAVLAEEFFFSTTSGPQSTALAVSAKNSPPDCFIHASTVLKEIITLFLSYTPLQKTAEEFFLLQII